MLQQDTRSENGDWDAINDITNQLVDVIDSLVGSDTDHVMARRAIARTIASLRAEKSFENEDIINKQVANQFFGFRIIDAGLLA
ncbi:MAG: hypothetical protein GYA24_20490 [Candidatus Lokiarchaeota archaeon]|nr:hypothetical protein [Candidatus Lokiarchaeota archaeon]